MAVNLSLLAGAGWQFFDDSGVPLAGGKLFTFAAGTTSPLTTFTDKNGITQNPNPIILDSAGRVPEEIWLSETLLYKFVLKTADDVQIWSKDDIEGVNDGIATFIASLANSSDPTKGDALIGFRQSNSSGNLPNAVGRTVHQKLQEIVSPLDFGAVGDGIANDTTAVLNALNSGANVVDGSGKTYKILSNIAPTSQNITLQNANFDISSITTGGTAIEFTGSQATSVPLLADILVENKTVSVSNTAGFVADGYAWLSSNTIFNVIQNVILGQIVKIKSIDSSTTMTLYADVLYNFTTAANATIANLTLKQNITFSNVNFIGADTGLQIALKFNKCAEVVIDKCSFDYVDNASIVFDRCVNAAVTNTSMRHASSILAYGVGVYNGCYSVKIANCYGEDQRHLVTVGDNDGVNLFVGVTNCHAAFQRDAGLDSHPAGDFILFHGNTIEMASEVDVFDGIICQALNAIISNNIIVGNCRTGIRHQILQATNTSSSVITNNIIKSTGNTLATDTGILIQLQTTGNTVMQSLIISNNNIDSIVELGIYVQAITGDIKNVTITGNTISTATITTACWIRAFAPNLIENFTISNNIFKTNGSENLYLLGQTAPNILNGVISGNTLIGGINGIRMIQTEDVVETGNYNTGATRKVFVDTGSNNVWLDRRQSTIVTMTNSTYIVLDQDEFLVANRVTAITVTLPNAVTWPGRELSIKTIQAQAVNSASSNVEPIEDTTLGTAILPANDGAWALLKSNGTNWVIMQRGL